MLFFFLILTGGGRKGGGRRRRRRRSRRIEWGILMQREAKVSMIAARKWEMWMLTRARRRIWARGVNLKI